MEGGHISLDVLTERIRSFEVRIRSNHDAISKLRDKAQAQEKVLVRIEAQLDDQAVDIAEMKNDMKWIKRGLFGAIAVGLMFTIAVSTLVVQVAH